MLSLFWTRTSAAAPVVAVPRYREDLQLFPGNGIVLIFVLVPVRSLWGVFLSPFHLKVAFCSARVERFKSSGTGLPEERSRFYRLIRSSLPWICFDDTARTAARLSFCLSVIRDPPSQLRRWSTLRKLEFRTLVLNVSSFFCRHGYDRGPSCFSHATGVDFSLVHLAPEYDQ